MKNILKLTIILLVIGIAVAMPSFALAALRDNEAQINVVPIDSRGNMVENVRFNVYEQESDIYGNKVLGKRLTGGYVRNTGWDDVIVRFDKDENTKKIALTYETGNNTYEKYTLWNQSITKGTIKTINLTVCSAGIVLKSSTGALLTDVKFDIYSAVTDINGNQVTDKLIKRNLTTGVRGEQIVYLSPGTYVLKVQYPNTRNLSDSGYSFTVSCNSHKQINYTLGNIKVKINDLEGDLQKKASYKLYVKDRVVSQNYYKEIGRFNTGDAGIGVIFLPPGEYRIEVENRRDDYLEYQDFSMTLGVEKSFSFQQESFKIAILDPNGKALKDLNVNIYTYFDGFKGSRIFSGETDNSGRIKLPLDEGRFLMEIKGDDNIDFTQEIYKVADDNKTLTIRLTKAKISFAQVGANFANRSFSIYEYKTNSSGNATAGRLIGKYATNASGYSEMFIAPGKYSLKLDGFGQTFGITITAGQLNDIVIRTATGTTNNYSTTNTTSTTANQSQVLGQKFYDNVSISKIYAKDTDKDGLTDFEETYIYQTNINSADTDNDSYSDATEVRYGYNPNGPGKTNYQIFSYGKPRLQSLAIEQNLAKELKLELENRLGKGNIQISAKNWNTVVNSYVYGGYSVDEIVHTIKYGPGMVHPEISAVSWRTKTGFVVVMQ